MERLIALTFFFGLASSASLGQELLLTPTEVRARWKTLHEWDSLPKRYSVTSEIKFGKVSKTSEWVVTLGDNAGKLERTGISFVWNKQYAFLVERDPGTESTKLSDITVGAPDDKNKTFHFITHGGSRGQMINPLTFHMWDTFDSLMQDGRLTITSVKRTTDELNEINYHLNFSNAAGLAVKYSGIFTVDANSFLVQRIQASSKREPDSDLVVKFQYKYITLNGMQLVESVESQWENDFSRYRFSKYDFSPVNPEQFRLSYYGLPEPEGVVPLSKPVPLYIWLLIATGVLIVIAASSRWLLRRRGRITEGRLKPSAQAPT